MGDSSVVMATGKEQAETRKTIKDLKKTALPSKSGNRSHNKPQSPKLYSITFITLVSMTSFLIGIIAILTPFWLAIDCSSPLQGRKQIVQPFPLEKLEKIKCGSTIALQKRPDAANKGTTAEVKGSGKGEADIPKVNFAGKLKVAASGFCIKKAESQSSNICGEDAFSVSISPQAPSAGRTFLAVADGVGGWSVSGGDSSKVSTGMLDEMQKIITSTAHSLNDAGALAFSRLAQQKLKSGATTICSAIIDHKSGKLSISNVGDSGAYVFRGGRIILKTKLGQEGFNAPHQLGFDENGNPYGSFPMMATKYEIVLQPGDIIVLATDGVLDNLYDEELREMVVAMLGSAATQPAGHPRMSPASQTELAPLQDRGRSTAVSLAWHAWARSQETHWLSPFSQSALVHGLPYYGGKQDDITIVVAVVATSPKS